MSLRDTATVVRGIGMAIGGALILGDILVFRAVWPIFVGLGVAVLAEIQRDISHWLVDKAGW